MTENKHQECRSRPPKNLPSPACCYRNFMCPRIEIASARVSDGERDTVRKVCAWAARTGYLDRIEVLGFLDGGKSVSWIQEVGGRVINLLAKGSEKHCRLQLKQNPEEHFTTIAAEVARAREAGLDVNIYLEDWSNGMKHSRAMFSL